MKKLIVIILTCVFFATSVQAQETKKPQKTNPNQRPKLHIIAFAGLGKTTLVDKTEAESDKQILLGGQGGLGLRVTKNRLFFKVDLAAQRSNFVFNFVDDELNEITTIRIKRNMFQLPVTVGYIPIKSPMFKWYVYGGFNNKFIIKNIIYINDEKLDKGSAKDFGFTNPNFEMRLGTSIDLAMFYLDFNYNIGLNKPVKVNYRTQSHNIEVNFGVLF